MSDEHYISIPVERTPHSVRIRRDSIFNNALGSFKGVNSLGRFASSVGRAQSFKTIEKELTHRRSFFRNNEELFDPDTLAPSAHGERLSTIYPNYNNNIDQWRSQNQVQSSDAHSDFYADVLDDSSLMNQSFLNRSQSNYSGYGAINSDTHSTNNNFNDYPESTPLVLKKVEKSDGKVVTIIAGQSTGPQTVFNSVNVLIGIGLLALPLAFKHSGWVVGVPTLVICAFLTFCSAEILSRCMDTDPTLMTYSDLAYVTFGTKGRTLISILFSLDLLASGVALIILFADSLNALFPSISINQFKIIAFLVLTPPSFLPLNILSLISLLGISSTISVVGVIFISGFLKKSTPGSLVEFASTNLYPKSWNDALIAIGLLLSPFGGHSIFPNLKVDMRHPDKFKDCLKTTYAITLLTDLSMAVIGFLMFGSNVLDEVTKSVLTTTGYPKWTYIVICALMSLVPLSKTPLNARPIITILDHLCGTFTISEYKGSEYVFKYALRLFLRVFVNAVFVFVAVVFPAFDKIVALMGSSLCFILCLILPCLFYLKICKETITKSEKILCYIVITISTILSIVATTSTILL